MKYVVYYDLKKQVSVIIKTEIKENKYGFGLESHLGIHNRNCVFDTLQDAIKYLRNSNFINEAV